MTKLFLHLSVLFFFLFVIIPKASAQISSTWEERSQMPFLKFPPSSINLSNNKVLVVGGGEEDFDAEVEQDPGPSELIYDFSNDSWIISHSLYSFRNSVPTLLTKLDNGNILVVGQNGDDHNMASELYDLQSNKWTYAAKPLVPARLLATASKLQNGTVLLTGGYGGINDYDSEYVLIAEIYDPLTNTWSQTDSLNQGRSFHTATVLKDGNVLVAGGRIGVDYTLDFPNIDMSLKSAELYNLATASWTESNFMLEPREGHTATLLKNGEVLVTGGGDYNNIVGAQIKKTAELYDPETNTWTQTGSMNINRIWHTASLLSDGKVLVVGGASEDPTYPEPEMTAELYDPTTKAWTLLPNKMNYAHALHSSAITNGKILVVGGFGSSDSEGYRSYAGIESLSIGEVLGEETGLGAFLELPFEYKSKGKSFDQMAYNPSSWFDHKYPLQNINCCTFKVTKFNYNGRDADDAYRSHSGYDYASYNGVVRHTPVLAAAAGIAIFVPESKSGGAGNTIKIDHGNGYQTWYEHLELSDLVVSLENVSANVQKGQMIGRVGMSGNTNGPHIHFSLIKDANNNGNFNDDYPFGLVDPLGWEGKNDAGNEIIDPWTQYSVGGKNGEKSYSLFIDKDKPVKASIPASGGSLELKSININAPGGVYPTFFTISANTSSYEKQDNLLSAMPSFYLYAFDNLGQSITQFLSPIQILYDYAAADLLNIKESTLKLYYFNTETGRWEALPSSVDTENKKVTASTTHFSHFALMGERIDDVSPTTTAEVQGVKGQDYWYRSSVKVTLNSQDNNDGVGLQYTLYSINDGDWLEYVEPITLNNEGEHTLTYQSFDKADNKSDRKVLAINIDKTAPEGEIVYDISKYDMVVKGKDDTGPATVKVDNTSRLNPKYIVSDKAGNTLTINTSELQIGKQVTQTIKSLQYNSANAIHLDRNIFFTLVLSDRNNALKQLDQYFSLAGDKKIFTKYTSSTDKTKIYTKSTGSQYTLELKNGLVLLNLYTAKGILKYQY